MHAVDIVPSNVIILHPLTNAIHAHVLQTVKASRTTVSVQKIAFNEFILVIELDL
jgi:hypothetical protein